MSRGQLPKAYLRIDPALAFTHPRPDLFLRLLCLANMQPARGRFRDWRLLCSLFAMADVESLRDRGDLEEEGGRWYVAGWDEWQEGDLEVGERMRRLRAKRRNPAVTEASPGRIPPSEASRRLGVTDPPLAPPGGGEPSPPTADVCTAPRRDGGGGPGPEVSAASGGRAERRRRARALRDDADDAERYWIELGGHPGPDERRQIREALRGGRPREQILGSIAERVRDELVATGRLKPADPWPPPGLTPFDPRPDPAPARASPEEVQAAAAAWGRVSEALRPRLRAEAWTTWIRPCHELWLREGRLQLEVPGAQHLDWIGRNWSAELQWAAAEAGLEGVDLVMATSDRSL